MENLRFKKLLKILSDKTDLFSILSQNIDELKNILYEIKVEYEFDIIFLYFQYKMGEISPTIKKEFYLGEDKIFDDVLIEKIIKYIKSKGNTLFLNGIEDEELNKYFKEKGYNFSSIMPIVVNKKVSGFLILLDKNEISYQEIEIELLKTFSLILSNVFEMYFIKIRSKEHEKMDSMIFSNLEELVTFQDKNLKIFAANKRAADSVNMKVEDLIGKKCYEIWNKSEIPCENCPVLKSMKTLKKEEGLIRSYDGRTWYIKGIPVFDDKNELIGAIETTLEITDKVLFEERFKTIFNQSTIGLTITDIDGKVLLSNPARCKMLGFTEEEMLKKNFKEYIYEEDLTEDLRNYEKLIKGEINSYKSDLRVKRKDGSIGWNRIYVSKVTDLNGNFLYSISLIEDITEQKELEIKNIFHEMRLRAIFEQTSVGVTVIDREGNLIEFNKAFQNMLGYSEDELRNKNIKDFTFPDDIKENFDLLRSALEGKIEKYIIEKRYVRKDGEIVWGRLNSSVIKDKDGNILYLLSIIEDITDRKYKELKLKEKEENLEKIFKQTTFALSKLIELKEYYTYGHQRRVSELGVLVARKMGLDEDRINCIKYAGLLHDIGKVEVPIEILNKPSKLTKNELDLIKLHSYYGYEILNKIDFPYPIAEVVYQHHERIDGSGYPRGLKDKEILLEAKILSVCDVVEAISSQRVYRDKLPVDMIIDELSRSKGIKYDEKVVDAILEILKENNYDLNKIYTFQI
jgi:PAS domain S-box-containing protein/putative nucleotidyltransferase with HDIG domain